MTDRLCACGHDYDLHTHNRAGLDCGACDCKGYDAHPSRGLLDVLVGGLVVVALVVLVYGLLPSSAFGAAACATKKTCVARPCPSSPTPRARITCLVKAVAWEQRTRAHERLERRGLSLEYIAKVGAAISGRPPSEFRAVGRCESTDQTGLEEYGFVGAIGWLQYQWPTWKGTVVYPLFGDARKDPLLETIAAAVYLSHGHSWSGPWAASRHCHGLS